MQLLYNIIGIYIIVVIIKVATIVALSATLPRTHCHCCSVNL